VDKVSFIKVFLLPELINLAKSKIKLLFLVFVVFISLWCIGFSNAIRNYLQKKMDNPFVRFVTVTLPMGSDIDSLTNDLNNPVNQNRFNYRGFSEIYTCIPNFQGINSKKPDAYIRAVNKDDEFYKFLLNNNDILLSEEPVDITKNETSWGCIVTEDYLKKLGYENTNISYIGYLRPSTDGTSEQIVPIPVAAVVKQLPDFYNMVVSENLYKAIKGLLVENPLDIDLHKQELCVFFETDKSKIEIENLIKNKIPNISIIKEMPNECHLQGIRLSFDTETPDADFNLLKSSYPQINMLKTLDCVNNFSIPQIKLVRPDFLSIPFSPLDSIASFQKYLEENHRLIRIDMNTVEAKSNFNFFDKISKLLTALLIGFGSILMISLLLNTILNHIEKNKTNLGTLKAFGMSNLSITLVYTIIATLLILCITISGYILSYFMGQSISAFFIKYIMQINIEAGTKLYLLNISYDLVLTFLILPILIIYIFIYTKLHNKTPGDLIYERE
jgi:hypothetical protein